jgi:hypothetical protein
VKKLFTKISISLIKFLVAPSLLLFLLINWLLPLRQISSSISPDQLVKVELFTRGFWGETWIDLSENHLFGKRAKIYTEEDNEVTFSEDTRIVWAKSNSRFVLIAPNAIAQNVKDQSTCLSYKESVVGKKQCTRLLLMYDLKQNRLWHNLYPSKRNQYTRLTRHEVEDTDWAEDLTN